MLPLKKVFIGAAGTLLAGGLVLGTGMVSYVRTASNEARTAVEDQIPIEFQLKRAQDMLQNELEPEIRQMKHAVAEAEVEVEQLTARLDERAADLAKKREELMARNDQLKSGNGSFVVQNVSYTREQMTKDLEKRLDRVKTVEKTFESERQVLAAKKRALSESEAKVVELLGAREELALQIKQLEARASAVAAAETIQGTAYDDSKLTAVREILTKVKAKVEVREKELVLGGQESDLIPVSTSPEAASVTDQVDAYLGAKPSETKVVDAAPAVDPVKGE